LATDTDTLLCSGYLIFFVVALVLLLAEIVVWWLTSPLRNQAQFKSHLDAYTRHNKSRKKTIFASLPGLAFSKSILARLLRMLETGMLQVSLMPLRVLPAKYRKGAVGLD